jgi:3-dehydroquinate dehydratase/shikimate dehydrogenase
MICLTLGHERTGELLTLRQRWENAGARLIELRLDHLREPVDIERLLSSPRVAKLIVTLRRPEDGGQYRGDEEQRRDLLRQAIALGADYVDLEPDAAQAIERSGTTQRIVSTHDFQRTPDDLGAIHDRLAACDADVVKIATMATSCHDNLRMLEFIRDRSVGMKTVGLCMGDLGTPSRLLSGRFGSPWTYASPDDGSPLAPGQLGFQQMRNLYRYDQIGLATELFGVVGDPIGHSQSPLVHNAAFESLGLDAAYIPLCVPAAEFETFLHDAAGLGLQGLSVTIPHKEQAARALQGSDPLVEAIGAANTLLFGPDGLHGCNTDEPAAMESLASVLDSSAGQAGNFAGLSALVLGAGGAAKAIVYGLKQRGARVIVSNRTIDRARQWAEPWGCETVAWESRHDVQADVLVNCTALGMSPHVDATPYDQPALQPGMIVFDTVYNPRSTRLIQEARARGCKTIIGIEMFVRQAALQFELFTGRPAPLDVMRAKLDAATL